MDKKLEARLASFQDYFRVEPKNEMKHLFEQCLGKFDPIVGFVLQRIRVQFNMVQWRFDLVLASSIVLNLMGLTSEDSGPRWSNI
ncbi:hypothetical protein PVK06_023323 [Gossypium arboreum]|uniref:Uncharacterized protein n=1 Tax=Gossypium arboreum TaxID=29729 RepID=A0ABR0PB00_GOSAR|nr:hypothetical protein PVK06_023323 [Gossypium arboreum]